VVDSAAVGDRTKWYLTKWYTEKMVLTEWYEQNGSNSWNRL